MNICRPPSRSSKRTCALPAWLMTVGLCVTPSDAVESVKKWVYYPSGSNWHSGISWDSDNPLDGGAPDADDIAVFDKTEDAHALLGYDEGDGYCHKLDARRGNVLIDGLGHQLLIRPQGSERSVLEVDSATLALENLRTEVDLIRLAPQSWDSATLELRPGSRIVGGRGYSTEDSTIIVGEAGTALLLLRTPSTPYTGSALIENFDGLQVGVFAGTDGIATLDPGSSLRTRWIYSAIEEGSTGTIVVHEGATLLAPLTRIGFNGAASLNIRGTFDGAYSSQTPGAYASDWALGSVGSALVTINGGAFLEDEALNVGRAIVTVENEGRLIARNVRLGKTGDGYVELYAYRDARLIARERFVVGQDGYALLTAASGTQIESAVGVVGDAPGAEGDVILSGGSTRWLSAGNTGEFDVGWRGVGSVRVSEGATLENEWGILGRGGGNGTARIDGPGSSWINHTNLTIANGSGDSGDLVVSNSAAVECAYSQIGRYAGSSGYVEVRDQGSVWTIREELRVGREGQGSLNISNGGRVESSGPVMIASDAGSTGLAVVNGVGSTLQTDEALHLGGRSTGTLRVLNGGHVENSWAFVGLENGVRGEATVSGPSSEWIGNSNMAIGHHGTGSILIQEGGYVQGRDLLIGRYFDGLGDVVIEDAASMLTSIGHLHVGLNGQGSLDVAGGGAVKAGLDFMVASGASSTGTAAISGPDSLIDVGRALHIGGKAGMAGGIGILTVAQAAAVTVADKIKLWPEGALELIGDGRITTSFFDLTDGGSFDFDDGTLTVTNGAHMRPAFGNACNETLDGTNPRLVLSNASLDLGGCTLMVGNHQRGALTIEGSASQGGAQVRSGVVFIAEHTESTGAVQLSGDSSVLETDVAIVANGGTGELSVGPGSHVEVRALTQIGLSQFGTGQVSVGGSFDTDTLIVGDEGAGALQVQTGGSLRSNAALVARKLGSTGSVLIADGGSWMANGSCYVGDFSDRTPGGTGSIMVGLNRPVGPATFAVAAELVVGSPGSQVMVQNGNLTAASIALNSSGRLVMRGGSVRADSVLINGGSLELYAGILTTPLVVGDLFTGGTVLSPGEPIGTMHVEGSFGQGGGGGPFPPGSSTLEFRGRSGAVEHDSIMVSGTATLGGTVHLRAIADFVPSPDDTFVLLRATTLEGTFQNAVPGMYLRMEGSPIECRVDYSPTSPFDANDVVLSDCRGTGDADGNGSTNLDDFAGMPACLAGPGEAVPDSCLAYDIDLNTLVDLRDFARTQIIGIDTRR